MSPSRDTTIGKRKSDRRVQMERSRIGSNLVVVDYLRTLRWSSLEPPRCGVNNNGIAPPPSHELPRGSGWLALDRCLPVTCVTWLHSGWRPPSTGDGPCVGVVLYVDVWFWIQVWYALYFSKMCKYLSEWVSEVVSKLMSWWVSKWISEWVNELVSWWVSKWIS